MIQLIQAYNGVIYFQIKPNYLLLEATDSIIITNTYKFMSWQGLSDQLRKDVGNIMFVKSSYQHVPDYACVSGDLHKLKQKTWYTLLYNLYYVCICLSYLSPNQLFSYNRFKNKNLKC